MIQSLESSSNISKLKGHKSLSSGSTTKLSAGKLTRKQIPQFFDYPENSNEFGNGTNLVQSKTVDMTNLASIGEKL